MRYSQRILLAALLAPATALGQAGTYVDRNVGDAGPNSVSQRVVDPGNARWSRNASMLDRFGNNQPGYEPQLSNPLADPRLDQRYLYQAPGMTALVSRPDYAVLTPEGNVARNQQGIDGAVVQLTPANIVYVLSPEYLNQSQVIIDEEPNPARVRPTPIANSGRVTEDGRIDGRYDPTAPAELVDIAAIHRRAQQGRHPDLVARSERLREERAREQAEREAQQDAESEEADESAKSGE